MEIVIGLQAAHLKNVKNEGQAIQAFVYDYFGYTQHFDNRITLESKSSVESKTLLGPVAGLQGRFDVTKKIGIEFSAQQALLFGNVAESGLFVDIDDAWKVKGPKEGPFTKIEQRYLLEGSFPLTSAVKGVVIPITDIRIFSYYSLTKNIAISAGFFVSMWQDAPIAPKWSMPGNWTSIEGTGWQAQTDNIIFSGPVFALNMLF
ncbi:MAG: hypothetical protein Q8R26_02460 [bacterium]|nr:hypothetical protein [bacterium]